MISTWYAILLCIFILCFFGFLIFLYSGKIIRSYEHRLDSIQIEFRNALSNQQIGFQNSLTMIVQSLSLQLEKIDKDISGRLNKVDERLFQMQRGLRWSAKRMTGEFPPYAPDEEGKEQ